MYSRKNLKLCYYIINAKGEQTKMINPKEWTEEQTKIVDLLLYRLKNMANEKWTNDETMKTYFFYPDMCTSEEEMKILEEISK